MYLFSFSDNKIEAKIFSNLLTVTWSNILAQVACFKLAYHHFQVQQDSCKFYSVTPGSLLHYLHLSASSCCIPDTSTAEKYPSSSYHAILFCLQDMLNSAHPLTMSLITATTVFFQVLRHYRCSRVIKSIATWLCHFLVMCFWANYLISQCFTLLYSKTIIKGCYRIIWED